MKLSYIKDCLERNPEKTILDSEREYREVLRRVSKALQASSAEKPIILLAGPSGSGKTTTAQIIEEYLDGWGISTHSLSMDNYFHGMTQEQRALIPQNKIDLESPDRLDSAFLLEQLEALHRGETIDLPRFDFATNQRVSSGRTLSLKKGELIVLEGIHALNPDVFGEIDSFTSRLYVCVHTRIEMPDGSLVQPDVIRLGRRMMRDSRCRNRRFEVTAEKYESVERGAEKYILPYKKRADFDIDSFIPYELGAYKDILKGSQNAHLYPAWEQLVTLLDNMPAVNEDLIPSNSLVREFIGGSIYNE